MLMPKRVKYRKQFRGRMKGKATRGNYVAFGEFGLQDAELYIIAQFVHLHSFLFWQEGQSFGSFKVTPA